MQWMEGLDGGGDGRGGSDGPCHPSALMRRVLESNRNKTTTLETSREDALKRKVGKEFARFSEARDAIRRSKKWTATPDAGCNCGRLTLRCMLLFKRSSHQWERINASSIAQSATTVQGGTTALTDGPLASIFTFYAKLQPPNQQLTRAPQSYDEIRECNSTVCLFEFLCFARDFGLVPQLISKHDLQALWRLNVAQHCSAQVERSEVSRSGMDLAQFMQFLVKVGLCAFASHTSGRGKATMRSSSSSFTRTAPHTHAMEWSSSRTRVAFEDEQPAMPPNAFGSSTRDRGTRSPAPPPASSRRSRGMRHRQRQEEQRAAVFSTERDLGPRALRLHSSILDTLRRQGLDDVDQAARLIAQLVAHLRLDDPAHVQHVILTKGRATSCRLNNYSNGETHGMENKTQLLDEARHFCARSQTRRRAVEGRGARVKRDSDHGVLHQTKGGTGSTVIDGATKGLDEFDKRVFGEGAADDSSDEEGGKDKASGGSGSGERARPDVEEDAEELRRRMATPPEEQRAHKSVRRGSTPSLEQPGAWQSVQFGRAAWQDSDEWDRRFNMLANTPLMEHPKGPAPTMMCLSPRGVLRKNVTNIGIHSHHFTADQKDALALYQMPLVAFLKPYVFVSKHRFLPLAVPSLDLGKLAVGERYQAQIQVRNTSNDVIDIHPTARGLLGDIATFIFSGTTSIIPGLWLTLNVEFQLDRLPCECEEVYGLLELKVSTTKEAPERLKGKPGPSGPFESKHRNRPRPAARSNTKDQVHQIPVYFQIRREVLDLNLTEM